jgi:hypothetical protein
MTKNLTPAQLLLIALAGILLLLAAFSLLLLQDSSAPLLFSQPPATLTATPPPSSQTMISTPTPFPTRQTSYTPFATLLAPPESTISPATSPGAPFHTPTPHRLATSTRTSTPPSTTRTITPTNSPSPAITTTLAPGEVGVTGRIVKNGTPVANAIVEFMDDVAPRVSSTNPSGSYWFVTLAPGAEFRLTFYQADNPQVTPAADITSLAWLDGYLPSNTNPVNLPDFELNLNLNGMLFELQLPIDSAEYSASMISSSHTIPFIWSLYSQGGSYHIELGLEDDDQPVWTSQQIASTNFPWDGTLDDGTHITAGTYWWRVAVTRSLGNYIQVVFTQPLEIIFIP